ncbi:hypothetical protein NX059_007568 [Plenodomus lindquistii]|nr:hypothetical protein NX059_007568 [Plenodomus lindquistii]
MPLIFCPYDWAPSYESPFGIPHLHQHRYLGSSEMRAPRWVFSDSPFGPKPCCDFCNTWDTTPGLKDELYELMQYSPHHVANIMYAANNIHHHFRYGLDRDGPESFMLARELERLSRYANGMHHRLSDPYGSRATSPLAKLSDDLKHMGRDLQMGPKRLRYRTVPKMRHDRRMLMWGW